MRKSKVIGFDVSKNLSLLLSVLFAFDFKSFSLTDYQLKKICIKEKGRLGCIKNLKEKRAKFDIILCMEVVEHVQDYRSFIKLAFECLKKDGIIIFSTINKSFLSYFTTILLAEKILKLVPSKTHDWDMYVKPEEILKVAEKFRFKLDKIKGLAAMPSLRGFQWIRINNTKVNYIVSIIN